MCVQWIWHPSQEDLLLSRGIVLKWKLGAPVVFLVGVCIAGMERDVFVSLSELSAPRAAPLSPGLSNLLYSIVMTDPPGLCHLCWCY